MSLPRIIFVDDETCFREAIKMLLGQLFKERLPFIPEFYGHPKEALDSIRKNPFNVAMAFLDHHIHSVEGGNQKTEFGAEYIKQFKALNSYIEIVMMSGDNTAESLSLWLKNGASKYLYKELEQAESEKLKIFITNGLTRFNAKFGFMSETDRQVRRVPEELKRLGLISVSCEMKEMATRALHAAKSNLPIMILGESGTGKELFASGVHRNSDRSEKPFVVCDCTQFQNFQLFQSEIFGSEKGAFTGAETKPGLAEMANGGTLFLDEIHHLGAEAQAMFLRFTQDQKIRRVGGRSERQVDVRIIVAGKPHLPKLVEQNTFLPDLFFRLNDVMIELPDLKGRVEDIETLAFHFLNEENEKSHRPKTLHPDTLTILKKYSWPGNVRELQKVIRRLALFVQDAFILPDHLREFAGMQAVDDVVGLAISETLPELQSRHESEMISLIMKTYQKCNMNFAATARQLGVKRTTLKSQCLALHIWASMEESRMAAGERDSEEVSGEFSRSIRQILSIREKR